MKRLWVLVMIWWGGLGPLVVGAQSEPTAAVRLRDVSKYVGQAFGFYVQVPGVSATASEPEWKASEDFEIRLAGSSVATQDGIKRTVFTYEAVPLRGGELRLPAGKILWQDRHLEIPETPVQVGEAQGTEEMGLEVTFSKTECYLGEPLLATVTWTSTLSFNGIKAVHFRLPLFGSPHFKVYPPFPEVEPKEPGAIGLPVSEERIIAKFSEAERNGKSAVKIVFQRVVVPQAGAPEMLNLPAAVLLCSYAEPRDAKFKGARYPSYFNNDFFDEDVSGAFTRYRVRSAPLTLRVRPLPEEGRPADFSGIVGRFRISTEAASSRVGVGQPLPLTLRARDCDFPALLDLPGLLAGGPLAKQFAVPGQFVSPVREEGGVAWTLPVRPLHAEVTAVPSLTFSYFDPESGRYETTRSEPIPLEVDAVESVSVTEAKFADGTRLRPEIRPELGGISHNVTGDVVLTPVPPGGWTWPWGAWFALFGFPPLLWLAWCRLTRDRRLQIRDPETARRELAFSRFRRTLRLLPEPVEPNQASSALRRYFVDRFGIRLDSGEPAELRSLARRLGVDEVTVAALEDWLRRVEWATFAPEPEGEAHPEAGGETLTAIVGQFERRVLAKRAGLGAVLFALGLSLASAMGMEPRDVLHEAESLFQRGHEVAAQDPAQAAQFYQLAAQRYEALLGTAAVHRGLVEYNLGNCYFLAGDSGRAILHYRRAEPWMRGEPRWRQALAHVRQERPDSFPLSVVTPGWRRAFFWHYGCSDQTRLQAIGLCLAAAWGLAGLCLFRRPAWMGKVAGGLAVAVALLAGSSLIHAVAASRDDAVILAREVIARKGDAAIYEPAFGSPLHAGTEVTILERRGSWWRIQVEDGNEGWIPAGTAEAVRE